MFDDPKRDLARLQRELLAAEQEYEEPDEDEDPEDALSDVQEILRREDWEESSREPLYRRYADSSDEPEYDEDEEDYEALPQRRPAPKKRRQGGLIVAALLEVTALIVILGWCLQWLRR